MVGATTPRERREMSKLRGRVSFANVMSAIAVFIALGGTSYAISQLPKNSVGKKQLKANAVTTAKIKKAAVTKAKIKNDAVDRLKIRDGAVDGRKISDGAVDGSKVADGSLTESDVNVAKMPFSRVVAKARGSATVNVPTTGFVFFPLENAAYTQAANEDDSYLGAVDVTVQPTCTAPRSVSAVVLLDTNPASPSEADLVAQGGLSDDDGGTLTTRIEMIGSGTRFQPGTAKSRTLSVLLQANCTAGSGITATLAGVDVIGTTG